jgi:hypothetical protein
MLRRISSFAQGKRTKKRIEGEKDKGKGHKNKEKGSENRE